MLLVIITSEQVNQEKTNRPKGTLLWTHGMSTHPVPKPKGLLGYVDLFKFEECCLHASQLIFTRQSPQTFVMPVGAVSREAFVAHTHICGYNLQSFPATVCTVLQAVFRGQCWKAIPMHGQVTCLSGLNFATVLESKAYT